LRTSRYGPLVRQLTIGAALVVGLAIVWILVTGYFARVQLQRLQARVDAVRVLVNDGKLDEARTVASQLPDIAGQAHRLTTGPAWWAASVVPYVGEPVRVVRATTQAADELGGQALPRLLEVAADIDPQHLRTNGNVIQLAPLQRAAPVLAQVATSLDAVRARVDALPHHTWLSVIDSSRDNFGTEVDSVTGYVGGAARAAATLPDLLGAHGLRRYFIGLQNESELRGTGGLPGSFAIVTADHGKLHFTHFESDQALLPARTHSIIDTGLNFGSDYDSLYGPSGPTQLFINSNVSPNFSYAAQIWAAMWQKTSGEHIDGALALDPQVLANFLAVTGPVHTPQGITVSAENVVAVTEAQEYGLFPQFAARKQFLTDVLRVTANRVLDGSSPAIGLLRAMSGSSQEHRVFAWVADASAQRAIAQTNYSGDIPDNSRPFVGVTLNNDAAGKLDYYLHRTVSWERVGCGPDRSMTVTVTLQNAAPAGGLPGYVAGRGDDTPLTTKPGDNRTLLDYFATHGAQLTSVTIDGKSATSAVLRDRGHPVFRIDLELPRGRTRVVVFRLSEPPGTGPVQVWRQPGVNPLDVSGTDESCS
jgi:hypothetical protein